MAHKSKTQRAKAAERKQNKQDREQREQAAASENLAHAQTSDDAASKKASKAAAKALFQSSKGTQSKDKQAAQSSQMASKSNKPADKTKKRRFQFLYDVRAEMKRVTWPSRTDVLRWSGVVIAALLFFGIYTALLDNVVVTPALMALTSLGA